MNKMKSPIILATAVLFLAGSAWCAPEEARGRFQVEVLGGVSLISPRDLNLLSRAEEQYNDIYFVQRHLGVWQGYFVNDFPEIRYAVPAGVRARFRVTKALSISAGLEGFRRRENYPVSGWFSYSPSWTLTESLEYDRFRLGLEGWSALGGVHYGFPLGPSLELEAGVAAGWTRARFDFDLDRTYTITYDGPTYYFHASDGHTLEGDGKGSGFAARAMVRLSRPLGRRFGVFVESSYTYCRLKSFEGMGRETRLGIPGETTWEGSWGIRREDIVMPYLSQTVYVPSNYWEGWVAEQRDRDFVLDLSGLCLSLGVYARF